MTTKNPVPKWWPKNPYPIPKDYLSAIHGYETPYAGWQRASDEIWDAVQSELGIVGNAEKLYGKKET